MSIKRQLALAPIHHQGKVITVEILGPDTFLCKVDGRELRAFYTSIQAAIGAGKGEIDEDINARAALSMMGMRAG